MAMSRYGLLPKIFSSIHPKFRTPWFSTILTGFMVAIPALFGYNYLLSRTEAISADMQVFVDELEKRIAEDYAGDALAPHLARVPEGA